MKRERCVSKFLWFSTLIESLAKHIPNKLPTVPRDVENQSVLEPELRELKVFKKDFGANFAGTIVFPTSRASLTPIAGVPTGAQVDV